MAESHNLLSIFLGVRAELRGPVVCFSGVVAGEVHDLLCIFEE